MLKQSCLQELLTVVNTIGDGTSPSWDRPTISLCKHPSGRLYLVAEGPSTIAGQTGIRTSASAVVSGAEEIEAAMRRAIEERKNLFLVDLSAIGHIGPPRGVVTWTPDEGALSLQHRS
jgi:hypothetical protein